LPPYHRVGFLVHTLLYHRAAFLDLEIGIDLAFAAVLVCWSDRHRALATVDRLIGKSSRRSTTVRPTDRGPLRR